MNSRDIIEEPKIKRGFLENIYKMQKDLLTHYQVIEGLPIYPVDVNTKTSQTLLKDFTARIIEELAEGFEAHLEVYNSTYRNSYWVKVGDEVESNKAYEAMLNDLQNVGEEQSDALHFFMELLIYANIEASDIISYLETFYKMDKNMISEVDLLYAIQYVGQNIIKQNYPQINNMNQMNVIDVLKPQLFNTQKSIPNKDLRFFKCGSEVNIQMLPFYKQMLWDITYHLNISRNFLKNKPWKQTEVMTQETKYQSELVQSFIIFIGYLGFMGCTPELIHYLYFKKNKINEFRIKSKY